jgi:hypothetical protein
MQELALVVRASEIEKDELDASDKICVSKIYRMIIFIDSSILGQLCNPNSTGDLPELERWFDRILIRSTVVSSTICDYEVRRGLVLAQENRFLPFLNCDQISYFFPRNYPPFVFKAGNLIEVEIAV